jgi:myosin-crossreactive antigen
MEAYTIGAGFGGLAAAAYLIRNAGVSGQDIPVRRPRLRSNRTILRS